MVLADRIIVFRHVYSNYYGMQYILIRSYLILTLLTDTNDIFLYKIIVYILQSSFFLVFSIKMYLLIKTLSPWAWPESYLEVAKNNKTASGESRKTLSNAV